MARVKRDYLSVVEAIYAPADTYDDWLQGIAERARPCVDVGLGVAVMTYDARTKEVGVRASSPLGDAVFADSIRGCIALAHDSVAQIFGGQPRVHTARELAQFPADDPLWGAMSTWGFGDGLAIKHNDAQGKACAIVSLSPQLTKLQPRTRGALARLAAHLGTGFRLRQRGGSPEQADGGFDRKGKLAHLNVQSARHVLESATETRMHGIAVRKESPEQALELWRALVSGRWSLVDHVDRDGKRFVLARRNPPDIHEPSALTPNERAVAAYTASGMSNKAIAYELGLAASTVSGLLMSALRKLRMTSRAELVAMFANPAAISDASVATGDPER